MTPGVATKFPKLRKIDLVRFHFEWNIPEKSKLKKDNEYSVVVRGFKPEEDMAMAFCDFSLSRTGYVNENFRITASYYYSFDVSDDQTEQEIESLQQEIARSFVWTKFFEIAKFALSQGDIGDVSIPLKPGTVRFVSFASE